MAAAIVRQVLACGVSRRGCIERAAINIRSI